MFSKILNFTPKVSYDLVPKEISAENIIPFNGGHVQNQLFFFAIFINKEFNWSLTSKYIYIQLRESSWSVKAFKVCLIEIILKNCMFQYYKCILNMKKTKRHFIVIVLMTQKQSSAFNLSMKHPCDYHRTQRGSGRQFIPPVFCFFLLLLAHHK